jgi:hypothetical protein
MEKRAEKKWRIKYELSGEKNGERSGELNPTQADKERPITSSRMKPR